MATTEVEAKLAQWDGTSGDTPESTDTPAATEPEKTAEPAPTEATADPESGETEPVEEKRMDIWRPARSGGNPRARRPQEGEQDAKSGKQGKPARGKVNKGKSGGGQGGKPDHGKRPPNQRNDKPKPLDPDNPFAALAALKEDMKRGS